MNIEIMRNTLYKAYLDDFASFCGRLGGATGEIMSDLLAFEADRRALNITLNSIGTELTRDDRRKLYSNFGLLYPHGHSDLSMAEDFDQVRSAMEKVPPYAALFGRLGFGESGMLDRLLFEEEAKRCFMCYEQQARARARGETGAGEACACSARAAPSLPRAAPLAAPLPNSPNPFPTLRTLNPETPPLPPPKTPTNSSTMASSTRT